MSSIQYLTETFQAQKELLIKEIETQLGLPEDSLVARATEAKARATDYLSQTKLPASGAVAGILVSSLFGRVYGGICGIVLGTVAVALGGVAGRTLQTTKAAESLEEVEPKEAAAALETTIEPQQTSLTKTALKVIDYLSQRELPALGIVSGLLVAATSGPGPFCRILSGGIAVGTVVRILRKEEVEPKVEKAAAVVAAAITLFAPRGEGVYGLFYSILYGSIALGLGSIKESEREEKKALPKEPPEPPLAGPAAAPAAAPAPATAMPLDLASTTTKEGKKDQ